MNGTRWCTGVQCQVSIYKSWIHPLFLSFLTGHRAHTASLILSPGETAEFVVVFCPSEPQRYEGALLLSVLDNQYERSSVQLVGEGYMEELTLDNIHSPGELVTLDGQLEDDVVEGENVMKCHSLGKMPLKLFF